MTPDEADAILIAYAMNAVAGPLALQERAAFSSRDGQGMKLILAELRALYAEPTARVLRKEVTAVDHHIRRFISLSPFVVVASGNDELHLDASPRGGEPGFVQVLDDCTVLVPDAPGNNRLDTLQNILMTSQVALLFFIPGVDEMLRIHGTANLRTDADWLARFSHLSKPPKLVIEVEV